MNLATQAQQNIARIKVLSSEQDAIREATEKEHRRLKYDVYEPRIREIEGERDRVIEELEEKAQITLDQKKEEIVSLNTTVIQVKRILEYLRLDTTRDLAILADDVKTYDRYEPRYKEDLGYYLDDSYLKIKLFIIQNGKPVNKYALIAVGNCLFPESLLKLNYSYGVDIHTSNRFALLVTIKDFPSVEQVKGWLSTHKAKLSYLTGEYESVKKEYQETKANYKTEDFQDFIFAECSCGYYYTIFEKDSYSVRYWDDARCPRCNSELNISIPGS